MWPDDHGDGLEAMPRTADGVPMDPAFASLEAELHAAGKRARRRSPASPTPAFSASLRARLLAAYAGSSATEMAPVPMPVRGQATLGLVPVAERPTPESSATVAADAPAASVAGSASSRARGLDAFRPRLLPVGPVAHAPASVEPRTRLGTPTVLPAPRWSFLAVAAALVLAVAGLNLNLLRPAPADSRVTAAVGATLVRGDTTATLTTGAELRAGDEIRIADGGSAALALGGSRLRLDAATDVRLAALDTDRVQVELLDGRAWSRVELPSGGRYSVLTGTVAWTALGTAFDLQRDAHGSAGDVVHELSVQHDVVADGPTLHLTVGQGYGATVHLGDAPTIATLQVPPATAFADAWIHANAAADARAGLPLGMLDGFDFAVATANPTAPRTPEPTDPTIFATPEPTLEATPGPTAPPTPRPTPRPTPKPTPAPTATPEPTFGAMSLTARACPGGVVLDWAGPLMDGIDHVQVLRGTSSEIPAPWPPADGVTAASNAWSPSFDKSDGFDRTEGATSTWYRAVAYGPDNQARAGSPTVAATTAGIQGLGGLAATPGGAGEMSFAWTALDGSGDCFSYYKLVASQDNPTPSYLDGAQYWAAIGDQASTGTAVTGLPSGQTFWVRLQAIRITSLGKFVAAQTDVTQVTIP